MDTELAAYNIDTITGDPKETTAMLKNLIKKGVINKVLCSDNEYYDLNEHTDKTVRGIPNFDDSGKYTGYIDYSVMKDDYKLILSVDDQGIYTSEFGEVNISAGGSVAGGTTLVTETAFSGSGDSSTPEEDQGKFTISKDGASVMFVDEIGTKEIDGKIPELSILVPAGKTANIYVFEDMVLTNKEVKRAAIDIEPGATLNLWVKDTATVTVNSAFSTQGATGNMGQLKQNKGGKGGYAGIRVPFIDSDNDGVMDSGEYGTLNISGSGTVIAYGGNASAGGAGTSDKATMSHSGNGGGRRRWSWSRNWWKWWKRTESLILIILLEMQDVGEKDINKLDMMDMQEKIVVM